MKLGLEIHQQLNTGKLFCSCNQDDEKPKNKIKRQLTLSKSELGETDRAAEFENQKQKHFIYQTTENSSCLVELDEEPPHEINKQALETAETIAEIFHMKIFDVIQFMRKIVIDGSNTTGFQRTALLASNGYIETTQGKVKIETLCLEEDSAKIIEETESYREYNLSRQGIPLIEIATDAESIKTKEQALEAAETIGLTLRTLKQVKRGLGTIRQDINISIPGGNRIEIKGAQDLKLITPLIEIEEKRQQKLIEIKQKINITQDNIQIKDLTEIFKNTNSKIIKEKIQKNQKALGFKIQNFKGILGTEITKNRRIGTEISDYVKAYTSIKGLFHSDELPNYGISEQEVKEIKQALECKQNDAFIIIIEQKQKAEQGLKIAFQRIKLLSSGVIKEVRQAQPDGTSKFLRPMPGSQRMYPETDIPYIFRTKQKNHKKHKQILERIKQIESLGLTKEQAKEIIKQNKEELILKASKELKNIKPTYVYTITISKPKELKRKNPEINTKNIDNVYLYKLLQAINNNEITKESIDEILINKSKNPELKEIQKTQQQYSKKEIEAKIKELKTKNKDLNFKQAMGELMKELRGKVSGKQLAELVKKYFN